VENIDGRFTQQSKSPIVWVRPERKEHAVRILFRTKEEADKADNAFLRLNNIPFMGRHLCLKRPPKYTGPPVDELNRDTWQDTLTKLVLWTHKQLRMPSRVVLLGNILPQGIICSDSVYKVILQDIRTQCGMFGTLDRIGIPKNGKGKFFVQYSSKGLAKSA